MEHKYYKEEAIVDLPGREEHGKIWVRRYFKLYNMEVKDSDGNKVYTGKMISIPNYEDVDYMHFAYDDIIGMGETLDNLTPITEEEYKEALDKLLSEIKEDALKDGWY